MPPSSPQTPRKLGRAPPRSPGTPRRRKFPHAQRLQGIKPDPCTLLQIKTKLVAKLGLDFMPDEWQIQLISKIRQGYDSVFCAGTGYGKSLVFEGLAALGGKGKVVIVISPLKALERDQVAQANSKGLNAIMINEDNTKTASLWKEARTTAQLVYISPEMALSESFTKLWQDARFRDRLQAIVVDEAHCIDDMGDEEFRPLYRQLKKLRDYTGQEVPFVACTATCTSKAFELIWDTLGFGHRPFWGIDVGCERSNLSYITRILENKDDPVLDILHILPAILNAATSREAIDKALLYFHSENACRQAVRTLRKVLPEHLRDCVQPFSSDGSDASKAGCWDGFMSGRYRILCATDAAGMGCNVPDVKYSVVFGLPRSLSVLAQRWGRAARNRTLTGVCILLVPKWAYRPVVPPPVAPAMGRVRGKAKVKDESKRDMNQRANLDPRIEGFINSAQDKMCSHSLLATSFRPITNITTYSSLVPDVPQSRGSRSENSAHELSWTILNLGRHAAPSGCCNNCNPTLIQSYLSSGPTDPRLFAHANDFIHPVALPPSRPSSVLSSFSIDSSTSIPFEPVKGVRARPISQEEKDVLHARLESWLDVRHERLGSSVFLSRHLGLPPRQMTKLVNNSGKFLASSTIGKKEIQRIVKLDMATEGELAEIGQVISDWRAGLVIRRSPQSQRRALKKRSTGPSDMPVPPQPNFGASLARLHNPHPPSDNHFFQAGSTVTPTENSLPTASTLVPSHQRPSLDILRRRVPPLPTPPPSSRPQQHYNYYTPQTSYNTPQNYNYYTSQVPYQVPSRPLSSLPSNHFAPIPAPQFFAPHPSTIYTPQPSRLQPRPAGASNSLTLQDLDAPNYTVFYNLHQ